MARCRGEGSTELRKKPLLVLSEKALGVSWWLERVAFK
jgi:hypothetical protein